MIDREKVIKGLNCHFKRGQCDICPFVKKGDCEGILLFNALALLKEQEAVEPIRKKLKFSETWECGNCHEELFEGEVIRDNYCPNCGRKVKWNERTDDNQRSDID